MKTILAHMSAKTVKSPTGKVFNYPERVWIFTQDAEGRWENDELGFFSEDDVIDVCKKATNWKEIKLAHFPMFGFSS